MGTNPKQIEELVQELPPEAQMEVRDFVEFLLAKHGHRPQFVDDLFICGSVTLVTVAPVEMHDVVLAAGQQPSYWSPSWKHS